VTPLVLAGIAAAVCLAGFVQGILGFGFGLVSMAIIPMLIGVKGAVPLVAVFGGCVNATLLVRFWGSLDARAASPLLIGTVAGLPVGVYLLRSLDPAVLFIALGVVVGAWVLNALRPGTKHAELGARSGGVLGVISGVLGGAFASGGPPAVVWISSKPWGPGQLRATLLAGFVIIAIGQWSLFGATGMLGLDEFKTAAICLPAAGVGSFLGARVGDRIEPAKFKRMMIIALAVVAANFVFKGIQGL